MMKSNNAEHAFELCEAMLNLGGLGHTAVIHTEDEELQVAFWFTYESLSYFSEYSISRRRYR